MESWHSLTLAAHKMCSNIGSLTEAPGQDEFCNHSSKVAHQGVCIVELCHFNSLVLHSAEHHSKVSKRSWNTFKFARPPVPVGCIWTGLFVLMLCCNRPPSGRSVQQAASGSSFKRQFSVPMPQMNDACLIVIERVVSPSSGVACL